MEEGAKMPFTVPFFKEPIKRINSLLGKYLTRKKAKMFTDLVHNQEKLWEERHQT